MSEDHRPEVEVPIEPDAIDLDTDPSQELDAAMQEALEAIESGDRESEAAPAPGETGEVEELRLEVERHRERALRALADLENYRKRVQRERQDEMRFKALEPMRQFLAVVDNLERAVASAGSVDDLKEGVSMILRQMGNLLGDHGVQRIEALGEPFDPSFHEAVSREEGADVSAPTVVEELQAGYRMHDRLLRPSVVKVAMPAARGADGQGDTPDA